MTVRLLFASALLSALTIGAARAETLVFSADAWCPYNCDAGEKPPGYMIEIARKILEPKGYTVEYRIMPYDAAIAAAEKGEIAAVIGAAHNDAPNLAYPGVSQGHSAYAFASPKGSGFHYTGPDSLKGKRLGVVLDYTYDDALDAYVAAGQGIVTVSSATATQDLVNLLVEGKADIIIDGEAVLDYTIGQAGLSGLFELTLASKGAPIYFAFAPEHPKTPELIALIDQGMAELRASGQLAAILGKYGLKDWEK